MSLSSAITTVASNKLFKNAFFINVDSIPLWLFIFVPLCIFPGNHAAAKVYEEAHQLRQAAVEAVLWDPDKGAWFDYNTLTNSRNAAFYPSNLAPLWAHCFRNSDMQLKAFNYLKVRASRAALFHTVVAVFFVHDNDW